MMGLMEPAINSKGEKPFKVSFKINESTNNWLGLGLSYKNPTSSNNYLLNTSTSEHKSYLICSSGSNPF